MAGERTTVKRPTAAPGVAAGETTAPALMAAEIGAGRAIPISGQILPPIRLRKSRTTDIAMSR